MQRVRQQEEEKKLEGSSGMSWKEEGIECGSSAVAGLTGPASCTATEGKAESLLLAAKGDVKKLCQHTRELLYELDAAGEVTNDLLANLIEALKEAPDSNFQRWLSNQVDLWSMRKLGIMHVQSEQANQGRHFPL